MKTKFRAAIAALLLALCLAPAADAAVIRVVVVQVENMEAYVKELEKGQAILKKLGAVQQLRVWRARFAGPETGTIVVLVEFPDLAALAEDDKKTNASAEFQTWIKNLAKQRKIVSDSLYDEVKVP